MDEPAAVGLPSVAEVLAPILARVGEGEQALLVALAERLAAERYRRWAAEPSLEAHRAALLACAEREEEIARRVEALFPNARGLQDQIVSRNPDLLRVNRELFEGRPLVDQLAIQANGERVGSATWRALSRRETEAARRDALLGCAPLEEESARALDAVLVASGTLAYRLFAVRIFVSDWERALRFYTETLGIPTAFRSDEMGWAQLATGGAQLALERAGASDPESRALVGRFVGVSLDVADVWSSYRVLVSRGVEFVAPPEKQPWGGVLAHLRDPDGNVITLLGRS